MVESENSFSNIKVKRIFVIAEGELIRFRPTYLLKYYIETFKANNISIIGFTIYGDNTMRELKLKITITSENQENSILTALIKSDKFISLN